MAVPPGFVQIYRLLPDIALPLLATYAVLFIAQNILNLMISSGIRVLCYLASFPIILILRVVQASIRDRVKASRLGASLPPTAKESPWTIYKQEFGENAYIGDSFSNMVKKYGNVIGFRLVESMIFTIEPIHIKAMLATQFDDFEKGAGLADRFFSLLGNGIFSSDGDTWKFHRSIARPFFSRDRISDYDIFQKHADEAISAIARRLAEGQPVEFQDIAARFTLDSATEFLFGKSVDSMAAGLPYPESSGIPNLPSFSSHPSNAFVKAFVKGLEITAHRGVFGNLWRLGEFWSDKAVPCREEVNKFIDPMIREALKNDSKDVKEQESLLSSLVAETKDYQVIQSQLINMLVAGRDTTSATLTFAIYMLIQHPSIARRLRDEILAHVGETRPPTYQDMRDMKYLRAFINETLRLYPIVPFNTRSAARPTTLPSAVPGGKPVYVPAGTMCLYSVFLMHRRTDLWGPDAEKFDPDRFIDARLHRYLTPNPFIFLPFNGGPRICIGQQFAYNEMSFFLIRLLQRFSSFSLALDAQPASSLAPEEWHGAPGTKGSEKIKLETSLTMFAPAGLWVRMEEAESTP